MKSKFLNNTYKIFLVFLCALFLISFIFCMSMPTSAYGYLYKQNVFDIILDICRLLVYSSFVIYPLSLLSSDRVWKNISIYILFPLFIFYDIFIFRQVGDSILRYENYMLIFHIIFGVIGTLYPLTLIFYKNYRRNTKFYVGLFAYFGISALFIPMCLLDNTIVTEVSQMLYIHYGLWWWVRIIFTVLFIPTLLLLPKISWSNARTILFCFLMAYIYNLCLQYGIDYIRYGSVSYIISLPIGILDISAILLSLALIFDSPTMYKLLVPICLSMPLIAIFTLDRNYVSVLSMEYVFPLLKYLLLLGCGITILRYKRLNYTLKDMILEFSSILLYLIICTGYSAYATNLAHISLNLNYLIWSPIRIGNLDKIAQVLIFGTSIPIVYTMLSILAYILILFSVIIAINLKNTIVKNLKTSKVENMA